MNPLHLLSTETTLEGKFSMCQILSPLKQLKCQLQKEQDSNFTVLMLFISQVALEFKE